MCAEFHTESDRNRNIDQSQLRTINFCVKIDATIDNFVGYCRFEATLNLEYPPAVSSTTQRITGLLSNSDRIISDGSRESESQTTRLSRSRSTRFGSKPLSTISLKNN